MRFPNKGVPIWTKIDHGSYNRDYHDEAPNCGNSHTRTQIKGPQGSSKAEKPVLPPFLWSRFKGALIEMGLLGHLAKILHRLLGPMQYPDGSYQNSGGPNIDPE